MILLKIKKPGYVISIPGLPSFRTPAKVDISKVDIRVVHMYLVTSGIDDYEIVAETEKGGKEVYKQGDFDEPKPKKKDDSGGIDKRLENLEMMMAKILEKEQGNNSEGSEQITNKLSSLEKLISTFSNDTKKKEKVGRFIPDKNKEPVIEELDSFIPEIDISDMKIKSKIKTMKKDSSSVNDSADILSNLVGNGNKDNESVE
jgi:hypothetical protein